MDLPSGILRVLAVVTAAFAIAFIRQHRRRANRLDCLHRGTVAAMAVGLAYLMLELLIFEAGIRLP